MWHCIRRNLRHLFVKNRFMACIIVLTQTVSVFALIFAYGLIGNYSVKNEIADGSLLEWSIDVSEMELPVSVIKENAKEICGGIENKLKHLYVGAQCDGYWIDSYQGYEDGEYVNCGVLSYMNNCLLPGEKVFTEQQLNDGSKVAMIRYVEDVSEIRMLGDIYPIIGHVDIGFLAFPPDPEHYNLILPLASIPDEARLRGIALILQVPLNESEHSITVECLRRIFGDEVELPEFESLQDIGNEKSNNTMAVAGVVIVFFAAVNYCMMYRYVLEKRRKSLAICRICGCNYLRAVGMYMMELLGMSIALYIVAVLLFHFLFLPRVVRIFEYMGEFYNGMTYLVLGGGYLLLLGVMCLVLVLTLVLGTPIKRVKEGSM